jgi:hypothetical protein
MNNYMQLSSSTQFVSRIQDNHIISSMNIYTHFITQCILANLSTMVGPLSSFVHSIYSFFFVKCSGIKSPFSLIIIPLISLGFLHSWYKNSRHSLMVFLQPFSSKVIKNRRKEVIRSIPFGSK